MRVQAFTTLLAILFIGCTRGSNPTPTEPVLPQELVAVPDSGVTGYPVKITGMKFHPIHSQNHIHFPGVAEGFRADSGNVNEIYTYVPIEAVSGPIRIEHGEGWGVVKMFTVQQEWSGGVVVLPFNLPGRVTEMESLIYDDLQRRFVGWSARVSGDSVFLTRSAVITENRYTTELLFINRGSGQLPYLARCSFRVTYDTGGTFTTLLEEAVIKVDSWNLHGIVSGRVLGRVWGAKFSFWFNFQ